MRILLIILFLMFPTISESAPSTTLSITPSATDGTTITASDENTRNSATTTWANAHDHNDIDQTANTLAVGDATAGNKTITANNADSNKPFIRYDDTNNRWVSSRDGTTVESFVVATGATAGEFIIPNNLTNNDLVAYSSSTDTLVGLKALRDADSNTQIQVEESANENIVRIDTNGTERWIMTATGERTMPTQPAFEVGSSAQSNLATGGVTLAWGTERFDQGGDFANNTFTAPITGKYSFDVIINLENVDTVSGSLLIQLITSNFTYFTTINPSQFAADVVSWNIVVSVLSDMDANDTATVQFFQTAGTAQTDISTNESFFSGFLAF